MRLTKRFGIFAMLALCAMTVSSTALAADKVIKIGVLFPLTGPAAVSGQNCVNSVLAAADVINNSTFPAPKHALNLEKSI